MLENMTHAIKVLRNRGIIFLWIYFWESYWFDLRYGVKTSSRVPKSNQKILGSEAEQSNGLLYVASFTSVTYDAVKKARMYLGETLFESTQFFDLGCGKGKALIVYAKELQAKQLYPAIGIEYDSSLALLAQLNLQKCGIDFEHVRVVSDSATKLLDYVEADHLIVYLYNSFQGETLQEVLNLLQAVPHILIYVDPVEREILPKYGYVVIHEALGKYNADTWLMASSGISR